MGNSADIRLTERSQAISPAQAEERTVPDAPGDSTTAAPKEPCDMTLEELFVRFETDIAFGMHSTPAEYNRSAARKEIQKRGLESEGASSSTIFEIMRYLRTSRKWKNEMAEQEVVLAWAWLCGAVARREPLR